PPQPQGKKLNLSTKPLKSFNWTKLPPAKVKETVWGDLDDADIHKKLEGEGYKEFEDLFAAKETKVKDKDKEGSTDSLTTKEISFLDSKKSQNVNIMLKAIKLDAKTVKKALFEVDTDTLSHSVLTELLKSTPTDEDLAQLQQYSGADVENLASAERFLYEVSEIDRYEAKLKAMYFKTSFGEYEDDAEALIAWLKGATDDVVSSKKFKELLKVILALGNYMNAGQRGGAYGFKLNSILKMIDTKSTVQNRKHTLLHYLTDLLDKKFPDVVGFQQELSHVEDGAKVTIPQIRTCLISIRDNLKELKTLLDNLDKDAEKAATSKPPPSPTKSSSSRSPSPTKGTTQDKFRIEMGRFHDIAAEKYSSLDERFKAAEKEYEKVVVIYGEDPKTTTPEEFFGIFWKFCQAFTQAKIDNETAVLKAIEAEKKEAALRDREEKRRKKREAEPSSKKGPGDQDQGGLDDLISAIRTGKAFGSGDGPGSGGGATSDMKARNRRSQIRDSNSLSAMSLNEEVEREVKEKSSNLALAAVTKLKERASNEALKDAAAAGSTSPKKESASKRLSAEMGKDVSKRTSMEMRTESGSIRRRESIGKKDKPEGGGGSIRRRESIGKKEKSDASLKRRESIGKAGGKVKERTSMEMLREVMGG
ncbi:Dishevelled associated activator of morphogenesis 2, partial [Borealophlyctis nickersoniae]